MPGSSLVATSADVVCSFHAGNAVIMREVCAEAARLGVAVGHARAVRAALEVGGWQLRPVG